MASTTDLDVERTARRRANMKLGWIIHAGVYAVVMTLLGTLSALMGQMWAVFPALGWGLGLAIHGLVVYLRSDGRLYEGLVERERRRLRTGSDPW
jgi:hypothetical protein